jgi:GAF domain-containing protein
MSTRYARGIVLAIILVAVFFTCASGFIGETPGDYGSDGLRLAALNSASFRVDAVAKGSSLADAGIKPGQTLRLADTGLHTRAAILEPMIGTRLTLLVSDGRSVTLVAHASPKQSFSLGLIAVKLAYLLVAGLLAFRRWEERAVRSLVFFLTGFGIGLGLPNANPIVSPEFSYALFDVGAIILIAWAGAAAADFSAHFSSAPSGVERALAAVAIALAAFGLILSVAIQFFNVIHGSAARTAIGLVLAAPLLLAIATIIAGYVSARGADRVRKLWVLLIIGVGMIGPALDFLVEAAAGYNYLIDQFALLTVAIIPIGLAYVILRHRLIDVGFVLNQAAVYAGVSIVIVAVLVIVETLLSNYVQTTSHVTSTAVQLAVALVLGFSINTIHKRVEHFVDRVLFRARHAAQAALHAFSLDAAYITDASLLLERSVQVVRQNARATGAGILLRDFSGDYAMVVGDFPASADVDPNDPVVLAMRARHVVVDLPLAGSALPGVLAFPMVSSGELIGILVCAGKTDLENYAPDERASLGEVAAAVAHALRALRIKDLEREVGALRALSLGAAQ